MPNPFVYSHIDLGAQRRAPDVAGYRCLAPDDMLAVGDVYYLPFGDGSESYMLRYAPFDPVGNVVMGGPFSNVGFSVSQAHLSPGFAMYRRLAPGEMLAAGGSSSKGNTVYSQSLSLP